MDHCLEFMAKIGINLDTKTELKDVFKRTRDLNNNKISSFEPLKDAFVNDTARSYKDNFSKLLKRLGADKIEAIVGYQFKEKSFLLEAFTHPSYEDNRLTHSYEKLEFLGDAVLDYLVTCYIYTHTTADPGKLTDIRYIIFDMILKYYYNKLFSGQLWYVTTCLPVSSQMLTLTSSFSIVTLAS